MLSGGVRPLVTVKQEVAVGPQISWRPKRFMGVRPETKYPAAQAWIELSVGGPQMRALSR